MALKNSVSFAVLFVDDEEKARKLFARLVSPYYAVFTAANVQEAMQILEEKQGKIGVLLTDQRMPGQLGVDLLRHVRKEYPKIIRMLTTAYSDLNDAVEAVNSGEIFRYINKPWNIDELQIDLRLAMDFFLLERDRSRLIGEKLHVLMQQKKCEVIKSFIVIAGGYTQLRNSRQAVKSFLEQTSDPLSLLRGQDTIQNGDFWKQEVDTTSNMASISQCIGTWLTNVDTYLVADEHLPGTLNWTECVGQAQHSLGIVSSVESSFGDSQCRMTTEGAVAVFKVIFRALGYQRSVSKGNIEIAISSNNSCQEVSCSNRAIEGICLLEQFSAKTNGIGADNSIAELFAVFLLIYHIGGKIKLEFDRSRLRSIRLVLPCQPEFEKTEDLIGDEWIEDLFVYSS